MDEEKKLTLKQRKWLALYIETGNATDSAFKVYDCKDRESAANVGWENVRKLDMSQYMEETGLSTDFLNTKLKEGLDSMKVVSARIIMKKNAPTSIAQEGDLPEANSRTDDFVEVEDYAVRHKYLETALKLNGKLVTKTDITSDGERIQTLDPSAILTKIYGAVETIAHPGGGGTNEVHTDST